MKITILVEGDSDIRPITKTFQYQRNDEFIFFESIRIIKKKIQKNLRLNINETLAVYAWHVLSSLEQKKSSEDIINLASQLLLPNQVLVGVPELLQRLTFSVTSDKSGDCTIIINKPIPAEPYFMNQELAE